MQIHIELSSARAIVIAHTALTALGVDIADEVRRIRWNDLETAYWNVRWDVRVRDGAAKYGGIELRSDGEHPAKEFFRSLMAERKRRIEAVEEKIVLPSRHELPPCWQWDVAQIALCDIEKAALVMSCVIDSMSILWEDRLADRPWTSNFR